MTHFTSDIQDEDILKLYFLSAIKGLSDEQVTITHLGSIENAKLFTENANILTV